MEMNANVLFWLWAASVWMITICMHDAIEALHKRIDNLEKQIEKEKTK